MANEKNTNRLPGFYIAVCCCVLIIGVAGYFTERKEKTDVKRNTNVASNVQVPGVTPKPSNDYPNGKVISVSEIKQIEEDTSTTSNDKIEVAPTNSETVTTSADIENDYTINNPDIAQTVTMVEANELSFVTPASGKILAEYSNIPEFNDVLCDYRTHNGVDIACDEGCSISVAADGKIEDISSNAFGDCITISHADGYMTKYECLGSTENLKAGDSVKAGDVIGTVGVSKGETVKESHLHFEIYKDDISMNPRDCMNLQ